MHRLENTRNINYGERHAGRKKHRVQMTSYEFSINKMLVDYQRRLDTSDLELLQPSNHKTELIINDEANIVLLPKTQDATSLSDYRPISLINRVTKIITKILANRLAPHMNSLASVTCSKCFHQEEMYS